MKLKEVYSSKFLKSFGDHSDAVGEIEITSLSIDPYAIARAMDYKIEPITNNKNDIIPNDVIYTAHFYKPETDNIFIAGQIAQKLWGKKPFKKIYVFDNADQALHLFVENMLMPEKLLVNVIHLFLQEHGGVSYITTQTGGQLLLLEICNQFHIPMQVALTRLNELHLIHLEGPIL